jgi:hypothetical protein
MHDLVAQLHLLDEEPGAGRQQQLWIHGPPCGWPSDPPGRGGLPEENRVAQLGLPNLDNQSQERPAASHAHRSSDAPQSRCTEFDPEPEKRPLTAMRSGLRRASPYLRAHHSIRLIGDSKVGSSGWGPE